MASARLERSGSPSHQVPRGLSLNSTKMQNDIPIKNFSGYFFIFCFVAALFFVYWLFRPFLSALVLAVILSTVFRPLYEKILQFSGNRPRLASFMTCLFIFVIILIPLLFFIRMLGRQTVEVYGFLEQKIHSGALDTGSFLQKGNIFYDLFDPNAGRFREFINLEEFDIKQNVIEIASNIRSFLISEIGPILKGFGQFFLGVVIVFFGMYYLFKDAELIGQKLMKISPLPKRHELRLFKKFREISKIALVSIFLKAVAQGIVCGIGFALVGINGAIFWGTMVGIVSVIPFVGTSLIWLPASLLLLLNGQASAAIFLFFWNLILTTNIDNVLCSLFIGSQARINPLLAFLSVFGGIGLFGLAGIIFGPLILAIFFTMLYIYELEYKNILDDKHP